MTTLAITPNWKNKTAKFKGTVAAGEHVSVTIQNDSGEGGMFIEDAATLRLRVVDPANGRTLAIFPEPEPDEVLPSFEAPEEVDEGSEAESTSVADAWDEEISPLRCTLNLNTVQMLRAVPPAANVPLLFVLDDYENKTLYFKELFPVEHWPRRRGEEEPTDLDNYKDIIAEFDARLADAEKNVATAAENVQIAADAARNARVAAETAATRADAAVGDAQNGAITAKNFASVARAAAESINTPDATLTQAGIAADAKATGERIVAEENRAKGVEATKADKSNTYTKTEVDAKVAAATPSDYDAVKGRVSAIEGKIPAQATADNQLVDKAFVNSSVATATATFRGTSDAANEAAFLVWLASLSAADANDYVFWRTTDAAGNTVFKRYKYNGTEWEWEFDLNNSSFTAEQWAAINSGLTAQQLAALLTEVAAKYVKPSGGIPASDLAQGVRDSLAKANTALQEHQDISGKRDKTDLAVYDANGNATTDTLAKTSDLASIDTSLLVSTTWAELKALRDDGGLKPGQQYRITDYVATTNGDMASRSANHRFDIIVTADDARHLNEHARAIRHEGSLPDDTIENAGTDNETRTPYFPSTVKFEAWDIWYCLDNDTTRFAWAVADDATDAQTGTPGCGVIYRMIDEFQNDVPYDFKGILFLPYKATDGVYRYTFDSGDASGNTDLSLNGKSSHVHSNKIAQCSVNGNNQRLNEIVFVGVYCFSNVFGANCYSNTFGSHCYSITFGNSCFSNVFSNSCSSNTFGSHCYSITFGNSCSSNVFSNSCSSNVFSNSCSSNTFGNSCSYNTFGNSCSSNTFGNSCSSIKFGTASSVKSYCRYIRIGSVNHLLYINPTGTTSDSHFYQNVEIKEGVNNTIYYKTIDDPNVGQTFLTTYKPSNSQEISL